MLIERWTFQLREYLVSLEWHEIHDLQVRDPELGKNIHIDSSHAELLIAATCPAFVEKCGNKTVISPLHIEIRVQGDREVFVRHLVSTGLIGWEVI